MEVKITKIYNGNYQRNGISGEGFFSLFFDYKEGKEKNVGLLMTFTESQNGKYANIPSCRVVDPQKPTLSWRGDNFGVALNDYFWRKGIKNIYDFIKQEGI